MSWAADGRDRTDDRRIQFSGTMCSRFRYVLVHVGTGRVVMQGPCHYPATASSLASRPVRSLAPSSSVGAAAVRTCHVIYLPKTAGLDVLVARAREASRQSGVPRE